MQQFSTQLTLGLSLKDEATFDNFYGEKNQLIVAELERAISGEGERVIYLAGTKGQGCSHLLQACCHTAHHAGLSSVYLPLANLVTHPPAMLEGLDQLDLVCLDDLHALQGERDWQEAVFHLYNRMYDKGGLILIAADNLPKQLKLQLPDLVSRLSHGIVFQLYSLSDEDKLQAVMMRAKRRGMTLGEDVAKYILSHCPRHMSTLFAALDVLDQASLAEKRKITIPFVKQILEI